MTEVVACSNGPVCGKAPYGPDHHGWDCPLSDPMGDMMRALMDPSPNQILENARRSSLSQMGVEVRGGSA